MESQTGRFEEQRKWIGLVQKTTVKEAPRRTKEANGGKTKVERG